MTDTITDLETALIVLAVVLSLILAGVIVAILTVIVFIMKRRMSQNTNNSGIYSTLLQCHMYTSPSILTVNVIVPFHRHKFS